MDIEFWASGIRDLVLLAFGGILTLAGTWLANRQARREGTAARTHDDHVREQLRAEAAEDARGNSDRERGKSLLQTLNRINATMRPGPDVSTRSGYDLPNKLLSAAEDDAELLHNASHRAAINAGIWLLYSFDVLAQAGRGIGLDDAATTHQHHVLRDLRKLAGAIARGEGASEETVGWFLANEEELDRAWDDLMTEEASFRADVSRD